MTGNLEIDSLSKSLLANRFIGILIVQNGSIEYVNSKAEFLFGLSEADLKSSKFEDLVEFDYEDNTLANLIKIGQQVIVRGLVNSQDSPRQISVDFSVNEIDDHCQAVFIATTHDRESFIHLKRQFYKRITHELRSPLSSIIGALALLKSGKLSKIESIVQIAERNSKRLTLMINSILDIEQFESGRIFLQKRRTDLKQVTEDAVVLVQEYAEEEKITFQNDCKPIPIDADEERLPQALAQIFRYFMGHCPGLVMIKVSSSDKDGWADLRFSLELDAQKAKRSGENEEFKLIPTLSLDMASQVIELHRGTLTGIDRIEEDVWLRLPGLAE